MAGQVGTSFTIVEGSPTTIDVNVDRDGDGVFDGVAIVGVVDGSSTTGSGTGSNTGSSTESNSNTTNSIAYNVDGSVVFLDYDGTEVARYTAEQARALTELPELPDHSADSPVALTGGQWNWTLEEVQGIEAGSGAVVGACYETPGNGVYFLFEIGSTAGQTRTDITLYANAMGDDVGSTYIDWGDGSATETLYGVESSAIHAEHTYSAEGTYLVSILGGTVSLGHTAGYGAFLKNTEINTYQKYGPSGSLALRKVWCGSNLVGLHGCGFARCTALESISFSPTMNRTDTYYLTATNADLYYGFAYDHALACAVFPKSFFSTLGYFGSSTFAYTGVRYVSLPAVTDAAFYLCASAFDDARALEAFCYPSSAASYGAYGDADASSGGAQFRDAAALRSIYIYKAPTVSFVNMVVPASFLCDAYSLVDLELPSNVSDGFKIGLRAFYLCENINPDVFVTILENTISFYSSFDYSCGKLHGYEWNISETFNTSISSLSLCNIPWISKLSFDGSPGFTKVTLEYCPYLKEVDLSKALSITSIGYIEWLDMDAFSVPYFVTSIGSYAFAGTFKSVTIGDAVNGSSITSIGAAAFYSSYLTSLEDVYIYASTPPTLAGVSGFSAITNNGGTIHVPAGSLDAYKAASNWSTYAADMVGDL